MAKILISPYDEWDHSKLLSERDKWDTAEQVNVAAIRSEIMCRARPLAWELPEDCDEMEIDEPTLSVADLYDLRGEAHVTVNRYGAPVLNSKTLAIADVDCSGSSEAHMLRRYPECNPVFDGLAALKDLDNVAGSNLWEQTYRVYRTHSGFRVMCVSLPLDRRTPRMKMLGNLWLRILQADPYYISLCGQQDTYRARLTPKPDRVEGQDGFKHAFELVDGLCVAFFEEHGRPSELPSNKVSVDSVIHPDLIEQIRLHDEMCLPLSNNDRVA